MSETDLRRTPYFPTSRKHANVCIKLKIAKRSGTRAFRNGYSTMSRRTNQEDEAIFLEWDALRDDLGRLPTFREAADVVVGGNERLLRLFRKWSQDQVTLQEMRALVPDRCMQQSERLITAVYRSVVDHVRSAEEHFEGELVKTRLELEAESQGRHEDAQAYEATIQKLETDLQDAQENVRRLHVSVERLTSKLVGADVEDPQGLPDAA